MALKLSNNTTALPKMLRDGLDAALAKLTAAISKRYDETMAAALQLVSNDSLNAASVMSVDEPLGRERIEALKAIWRSPAAKELLKKEDGVASQYDMLRELRALTWSTDALEDMRKAHLEKIAEISACSGVLALAQSLYKTLKSGESRIDIVGAVRKGLAKDEVRLDNSVVAQIDHVLSC